ncbi:hypothetical protein AA313_de0202797 [Arthrobotrys entomopaga]|nr:hypothetical protein AA313_de0202797 [Arthrobotrys entomopaga]
MSARQRHTRTTTSDGWTTISHKPKINKSKKTALQAHKSDLDIHNPQTQSENDIDAASTAAVDPTELEKVKKRLDGQIHSFKSSKCHDGLRTLFEREVFSGGDGGDVVDKVLVLALGSVSENWKVAPGYQLAAALTIIDLLKEEKLRSRRDWKNSEPEMFKQDRKSESDIDKQTVDNAIKSELQDTSQSQLESKNLEEEEGTEVTALSYDPVYTSLDTTLLPTHGITLLSASAIPDKEEWYRNAVVYMPHASIWLNHKYFKMKPKVWIGNSFEMYEIVAAGGGEVGDLLKEVEAVVKEGGYVRLEWPDEEWGGGAVFNNLVVYVRKDDGQPHNLTRINKELEEDGEVERLVKKVGDVNLD